MSEFITVTLEDVCTKVTDGTHDSPKLQDFGVPFIKAKHITKGLVDFDNCDYITQEEHEKVIARSKPEYDDILFTNIGASIGRTAIIKSKIEFSIKNVALFKPDPKVIDPDYLYFKITSTDFQTGIKNLKSGSAQPFVSLGSLRSFKFEILESLDAQKEISNTLLNYDNLIENNNRRIAILEEMAQSLYREWFVNFRYPGHTDDSKNSESSDENSSKAPLIDSPLGPIPEGWEVKPLCELIDFKRNTIKKGSVPPKTPYMGLEHFPRKSIALSNWDEVNEIGSNKLAFERGDILFGKIRPNFHKVGVAQIDGLCSSDTFVLSSIDSDHHALISMVTFSDEFVAQAVQTSQGSKMPRASWDVLKEFPVCIPSQEIIEKFNAVVNPAIEQVRVLSLKNRNLKKQRDMLLPKLISGDIEL